MRSLFLTIISLLVLAAPGFAGGKVQLGVKAGGNLADLSGDGWRHLESLSGMKFDNGFRTGFVGGIFARFDLGAAGLTLEPEVLYVMKGSKVDFDNRTTAPRRLTRQQFVLNYKIDYLEIPILLKYRLANAGPTAIKLSAGPFLAIKIKSRVERTDIPAELLNDPRFDWSEDELANAKDIDLGIVLGAGVDFPLGRHVLIFDVRFNFGLTRMTDDLDSLELSPDKAFLVSSDLKGLNIRNRDIRFMIGFRM